MSRQIDFRAPRRAIAALRACVAAILTLALLSHASPHSWYPWECCSERDCFPVPVPRTEIDRTPEGWRLKKEGITVPFEAARPSPDGKFHLCRSQDGAGTLITPYGKPPCFWAPEGDG